MGHASIQVTADVYGHLVPGANVSFVDKLDSMTSPQQSATQPQQTGAVENREIQEVFENVWLGRRDSNPDTQLQRLQSYRWTTSHQRFQFSKTAHAESSADHIVNWK